MVTNNIINESNVFRVSEDHKVHTELYDDIEVLVVDNFYENPELVRELALTIPATNYTTRGNYPAATINVSYNMLPVVESYRHYIQSYFPNCLSDEYIVGRMSQSSFMVNVMQSDGKEYLPPHIDCPSNVNLASSVFLNTPEECSGGTSFFKNEELTTLLNRPYLNKEQDARILELFKDIYKDDCVGCVEMKYNRMVLYHQNVQHTAFMDYNSFVGDNYRINQMFFI